MEKFKSISKITNQYLRGKLCELNLQYETDDTLNVSVLYEDDHEFWFDYELSINIMNHDAQFKSHQLKNHYDYVQLYRDKQFEDALVKSLFQS